jgi:endonuclease YncB( thermonuclease family)
MNTAEDVKYVPGFAQPFINPPANSKAGRAHRQNAINRTGVDPYMAKGFIPNFADSVVASIKEIKDGDTISAFPVNPTSVDYRLAGVDAAESNQRFGAEATSLLGQKYINAEILNKHISSKAKAAYYRNLFDDKDFAQQLVIQGLGVPDLRYTKDPDLLNIADQYYKSFISGNIKSNPGIWGDVRHPKFDQYLHQRGVLRDTNIKDFYKQSSQEGTSVIKDKYKGLLKSLRFEGAYDEYTKYAGFIPNFAPPTSAIRIPWFKKFGNPAFDAIQPALGISKASDVDTFRQVNFRSTAEGADEKGDSNIFGPLYETFSRKALQLINKSNIFGEFVRGSALQPKAISSQTAFDEALLQKEGIVAFDFKGFPKKNLSGSVPKHLNDKFNRVVKTDPEKAAKIKESIMAFNETGHESQLPSQFGKNFLELAGTSYSRMLKNSPDLVKALSAETDSLLNNYVKNPAFLAMAAASGFIPNFNGKKVNANFYRTKTGPGDIFPKEGTGLSGTNARKPGERLYGYMLEEAWNNMVMSILGNNVFIPDASSVNPRLVGDVNEAAQRSAKSAALNLSSAGRTTSLGLGRGMSENFGNSRYVPNPDAVYTGKVSGKMKKVNYDRLSKVLGVFWSSNPETKSAWDFLKNYAESGKFVDKKEIKSRTGLLRKSYEDWLIKNSYIGTQVKLSDYRKRGEGVGAVNYAALRSDLAGVSNLQNLGEMEKLKKYKEQGIFYGDYKNNKAMYDKMGRWAYNAASKKMILNSASGFIPNFAYKQAVMGLEESMSGNKAIFDTKPFPHIRNSSQPTFSSAIADHGGLGNALSDSMRGQKAAGLMHGGFIPNFGNSRSARRKITRNQTQRQSQNAQSGFDPAILQAEAEKIAKNVVKKMKYAYDYIGVFAAAFADTIEKGSQQAKAALSSGMSKIKVSASNLGANVSNSVNNAASNATNQNTSGGGGKSIMGAFGGFGKRLGRIVTNPFFSIATSSIAGQIESFYSQNRTREKLSQEDRLKSTALSSALNFGGTAASVGGMVAGVPGAIIGGIGGSLVGLGKAIIDSRTNLEDLTKQYQESISKQQENSQAASEYISLQTKLINSTSTNFEENKKISREAALAFSSIKDSNLKIALNNAGNDIEKMSKVLEEYSLKQKEVTINIEKFSNGIVSLNKKIANEKGFSTSGASTSGFMGIKTVQNAMTYVTSLVSGQPSNKYLSTLDVSTQQNREKIYAESSGFFELITDLSTKQQDVLQLAIQKMFTETGENLKGGLESVISGLDLPEQKKTILSATLRQAKDEGSLLLNTLFNKDDYNILAQGFSEYNNSLKENIKMENNRIVSLANLNYALKQSEKSLDRKVQDLSRENETVGKLERIRSKNVISGYEQLFGKKASLDISYGFEEEQINLTQIKNNADILNKLLKSQPANLSDEAKTNLINIRKRINPYNPERTISEMQDFMSETYKTTDPLQLVGEGKVLFDAIVQAVEDLNKNSKDSADQLIVAAQEIKSAAEEFDRLSNFTYQFRSGFRDLATEGQMLIGTIGRQLPKMFADGLVDGIKAAIRESDNLGQALMGIAAKFLDEISTMMLRSSIYQIMGSFAPSLVKGNEYALMTQKQKGGLIRAQSGMYVSGSGTGDKYPALLENGEYVLNRRAVMAMGGPASLDQLNFAMAPRFASGGSFSNEFTDLKSMEANMTSYGMENSKLYGELRDAEVAAAEERRRKAFSRKQQRAALIGSLAAAVASIGIGAGIKNLSNNKLSAQAGALGGTQEAKDVASMPLGKGEKFAGSEVAQFVTPKQYNQINSLMQQGYLNSAGTATTQSYSGFKGFFTGPTAYGQLPWYQRGSMNPFAPKIGGRQTGGLIGSRLSDTIPGYMEGGLYNTPIVKRYGVGMQAGGMSPISNSNSNVVNTTNATNSFNFNTNVSRDGTIEVGSSSTSYAQQDVALSKNLNSKVYAVVLDAIKNEQRFGGSLAGTRQG